MSLTRTDISARILAGRQPDIADSFEAYAPVNIALCKYWGKRNAVLNLPVNDSLSISLGNKGTTTRLTRLPGAEKDKVFLNGKPVDGESAFCRKVVAHIDLFRPLGSGALRVETRNDVATGAGLASSASGFAALTKALVGLYGLTLSNEELSIIARLGSGSASRSIYSGFAHWHRGVRPDGMDSFASSLDVIWPELRVGVLTLAESEKPTGSREGMQRTVDSAILYNSWPEQADRDIRRLEHAITVRDFTLLGSTAEQNAMAMHATMLASWPPLLYWQPESVEVLQKVWQVRQDGVQVFATMDAGPNVKVLFESNSEPEMRSVFQSMDVIAPFS
ncbi:diphosphomevalonate decarboxylase [Sansalvadorimonas sp. 2012CJ34-2]|uniref:diphosphomevalonate decarboxylase n=1 Tax=Parendozoicomonas callyspongiae TaxID=2942213 RepID=A0ABT0PHF4_9GAMM|nr:diphosphomevalonate decarboxylase [Sansalvadorimonas sp. 2012CJ34-2]MCL6270810.1 diphosphomevalonate decarboxylase [Sansalvadorimonas sp. 2012CJ34-2]